MQKLDGGQDDEVEIRKELDVGQEIKVGQEVDVKQELYGIPGSYTVYARDSTSRRRLSSRRSRGRPRRNSLSSIFRIRSMQPRKRRMQA